MGETAAHLTHKALTGIDIAIIAIYFVVIFAIGFYFARKERTSTDYFLASRNVGWFAIGASLFVGGTLMVLLAPDGSAPSAAASAPRPRLSLDPLGGGALLRLEHVW